MVKKRSRLPSALAGPLLTLASVSICLIVLEAVARVWTSVKWEDWEISQAVDPVFARSGFVGDPVTGYAPQPGFSRVDRAGRRFSHNDDGFRRSDEVAQVADSVFRVVIVGASTVYGIYADDDRTSSSHLQRLLSEEYSGIPVEVVNLGVQGWTSRESVTRFEAEVARLSPDVVIMIDGRNDLFPELFDGYSADYSHFRKIGWRIAEANRGWKKLFKTSHLSMLLLYNESGRRTLGYSRRDEDPVYGYIRFENQPDELTTLHEYTADSARRKGWRDNVSRLIDTASSAGAHTVLVEMPFRREGFGTGVLPLRNLFAPEERGEALSLLERGVEANNAILEELALREGVSFVETDHLVYERYLVDDCHFNESGEAELARTLAGHLVATPGYDLSTTP